MRSLDTSKTSVVILAGGTDSHWLQWVASGHKALVPVNGKPMYEYVRDAFLGAGFANTDVIVDRDAPVVANHTSGGWKIVKGGSSFDDNLATGLDKAKYPDVIVCTCDIICISPKDILRFFEASSIPDLAIGVSIVDMAEYDKDPRFVNISRHAAKLAEGRFTLGNMFRMNKEVAINHVGDMGDLYNLRKSISRLAIKLGISFLGRFILAQICPKALSVSALEKRGSEIMHMPVRAIKASPAIGADFDKPAHVDQLLKNCF